MFTKDARYGSEGRMYAEMYFNSQPATFPASSDDIPDIKNGYGFTTGSILYVVATGDLYMYDTDSEEWIEQ